jgi:hypothetical protein
MVTHGLNGSRLSSWTKEMEIIGTDSHIVESGTRPKIHTATF